MKELKKVQFEELQTNQLYFTYGGTEPAKGSYAAGYAVGSWFREMYSIWSYGLTHLNDH